MGQHFVLNDEEHIYSGELHLEGRYDDALCGSGY